MKDSAKKALKIGCLWVPLGLIALGVIGSIARHSGGTSEAETETPTVSITVDEITAEYRENEVRADSKYQGKVINLTGTIRDFHKGALGGIHIQMGPLLGGATVEFFKSQEAAVAAKSKGDLVSVNGKCAGKVLGTVVVKDATLQ